MADTLDNIDLPANTWVNLYAHPVLVAAGIAVGTQISVQNLGGGASIQVHAGANEPASTDGYRVIAIGQVWQNDSGDTGAWVRSPVISGLVNARAE